MAARQTTSQTLKSITGASIFALGLLLLFVNLDGAATQMTSMICNPVEAPGMLATIGLAGLHAMQAYTFNHDGFFSSLLWILVSFWPLLLIAIGAALLRGAFIGRLAKPGVVAASSGERTY
jgi:hypothetical protein